MIDVSGTAERIESLKPRVDRARPVDERDVDLRCDSVGYLHPADGCG